MSWSEKDEVILKRYFSFNCKWSNTRRKVIEYIEWDEKNNRIRQQSYLNLKT